MQDVAVTLETVYVDLGYRLEKEDRLPIRTLLPDMKRQMIEEEQKPPAATRSLDRLLSTQSQTIGLTAVT